MKWIFRLTLLVSVLFALFILSVYLINRSVENFARNLKTDTITDIPFAEPPPVAIVFGAGLEENKEPSGVLQDRIVTAVELYRAGRVRKILMSGDNRFENYNEPVAMKETAVKMGVPEENVIEDLAGRRTFDTCYRAQEIFGVSQAVLVTQDFHLNRALYLCNSLGVKSIGIKADRRNPQAVGELYLREFLSTARAWFDLNIYAPTPVLGKKQTIEP